MAELNTITKEMRTIKRGDRGNEVGLVQQKTGARVDGEFGAETERAVKTWQRSHNLTADGIVGPQTWASMGWGDKPKGSRRIDAIVIHCTAGPQTQNARQVVDYHTRSKAAGGLGWSVPGYHYIIEPNGNIVNTLSEAVPSNGVKGHNEHIINISYIGGIDSKGRGIDNRTPAQKTALIKLLKELRPRYSNARIMGHRDIASTDANHNGIIDPWERVKECPCFDAIPEYSNV